ncbi:MAG: hypothetical protein HY275_09935 [Gemmatimonadetes bacterium]|nr:hypothetical protein [Gemmatimonadota bacterium]
MHPAPPFALAEPRIAFPALATRAARTPLGGGREALWALWMLARLAAGCRPGVLPPPMRVARAAAARAWLSALSLPPALRPLILRTAELTAGEAVPVAEALSGVIQVTAPHLDRATAAELQALLRELVP